MTALVTTCWNSKMLATKIRPGLLEDLEGERKVLVRLENQEPGRHKQPGSVAGHVEYERRCHCWSRYRRVRVKPVVCLLRWRLELVDVSTHLPP